MPRLLQLQVAELYRFAPRAAVFAFIGALLTLAVLIDTDDLARGSLWFLLATAVTVFRIGLGIAYRRREPGTDPAPWARLAIAGNLAAGVLWGLLGTVLFPEEPGYRQLFTIMVIIAFVAGSVTAYAPVRGAHEALSVPASLPTALNLFTVHPFAGVAALLFAAAIVYYARTWHRLVVVRMRLQIERDDLLEVTRVLNAKLVSENRDLAHRAAVRGVSVESARERADRMEALFENSPLPHIECDAAGQVVTCNAACERALGIRHHEIVGRALSTLLPGPAVAAHVAAGAADSRSVEVQVRRAGGTHTACTASFTPLPGAGRLRPGFAVVLCGLEVPAEAG